MTIFFSIVAITIAALVLYFLWIRPWQLRWGATDAEVGQTMPGDDIVQSPHFKATRAVTIQASPAEVWPWIVQIGSARAGWYSLDRLDNGGKPSSREILPEFQKIELDYFVPFTPDQKNGLWVKAFQENNYILWWDKKERATWLWLLEPLADGRTRLLTRLRTIYDFRFPWLIYYLVYDVGDIVMMSKCMLGIKERAEAQAATAVIQNLETS
jgi:hypothetical protein